jgi:type IV pilus assembly protein PilY1
VSFTTANASTFRDALQASSDADASDIIRYVNGEDFDDNGDGLYDYRPRTVDIVGDNTLRVWKLGDIVNSTPKISSWIPLNTYHSVYSDTSYAEFIDRNGSYGYGHRGMVFTGGNDGMLHAFKLGRLYLNWTGQTRTQKAWLDNDTTVLSGPLGNEAWAFVPRHALPYLKYQMDNSYCHLYTVDLTPYVFDASVGSDNTASKTASTWRTILIGGMRTGGACRDAGTSCNGGTGDCVNTPVSGLGYSSYYALDVTDQNNPVFLWEFTDNTLGYTTTGPAVIRVHSAGDSGKPGAKTGNWYVVFGSGPTGPIDNTYNQFMGRSDQPLKLFVLDLRTGALLATFGEFRTADDSGSEVISNAFGGSFINGVSDLNTDYTDDALYFGYTRKDTGTGRWTQGGVARLSTRGSLNPNDWKASIVRDGVGSVTAAVTRIRNRILNQLWLFFGTGRYFYVRGPEVDDAGVQRRLYGIKEPCFRSSGVFDGTCVERQGSGDTTGLTDVTNVANTPSESTALSSGFRGWFIDLDAAGDYNDDGTVKDYESERVITDPMATASGVVFFTSYKPYDSSVDECAIGGKSFIWAVKYNTGGEASALLKGKALVQVSTASVEQVDLATAFRNSASNLDSKGGRRSGAMEGVPPTAQGLSLITSPPPVKRVLHMKER